VVVKQVENAGGGCFFVKKWTFPQRRVHYVQYQYFLFYILLIWGCVPPAYGSGQAHVSVDRVYRHQLTMTMYLFSL